MHRLAALRGGRCLSAIFAGTKKKLQWRCAEGHKWESTPKNVLRGNWCRICGQTHRPRPYSLIDFKKIARKRGGDCLSTEFKNFATKLLWKCAHGHRWGALPQSVKRGSWCPYCIGRHKTIRQMRGVAEAHGGKCLSQSYRGGKMKLLWECAEGHRWRAVPSSIQAGTWCPVCAQNRERSIREMQATAREREGKCLSTRYAGMRQKLLWECAEGHRWMAEPTSIQSGSWCARCSSALGERICREHFEQLFKKPFPKSRPEWLQPKYQRRLELDGYCEDLKLAFEHQGPHHYGASPYSSQTADQFDKQRAHDRFKRLRCRTNGIVLISVPEIPKRLKLTEIKSFIRQECEKMGVAVPKGFERRIVNLKNAYAVPRAKQQLQQLRAFAAARGGKCLSPVYMGSQQKLLWQCEKRHRWHATPSNIKTGYWCPHCFRKRSKLRLTIYDMQALAKQNGGKCLSHEFLGTKVKLEWECQKGHRWKAQPGSLRAGTWCPVCAGTQRLTIEHMKNTAREHGGECLSEKYVNGVTKLRWRCSEGHAWKAVPDSIRQGTWCPTCARIYRLRREQQSFPKTKV
jgi:hypothetical protein